MLALRALLVQTVSHMAKTKELPGITGVGVSPVQIADVDRLAEIYVRERDKRMKLTPREVNAKQNLVAALHAHESKLKQPDGTIVYRFDSLAITLTPGKEKLKVEDIETKVEE